METKKNVNDSFENKLPTKIIPQNLESSGLQVVSNFINKIASSIDVGKNIVNNLKDHFFLPSFSNKIDELSPSHKDIISDYAQSFLAYEIADDLSISMIVA